jgi:hypothetical protein
VAPTATSAAADGTTTAQNGERIGRIGNHQYEVDALEIRRYIALRFLIYQVDIINSIADQVARREGTSPTRLRPLYEVVDTDALQRVIGSTGETGVNVEFAYSGYLVSVSGDGSVHLDATSEAAGRGANL